MIRERGSNPAIVNEQIKRERAEEESAKLVFTTNLGSTESAKMEKKQTSINVSD